MIRMIHPTPCNFRSANAAHRRMFRMCGGFCVLTLALSAQPVTTFAKLKSLAGDWAGTAPNGRTVKVKYEVTAGGAAVIETRHPYGEPSMITVFFLNGAELGAAHYCSSGVHPRLRSKTTKDGVEFSFVDAINLKSANEGHIHGFKFRFVSDSEMEQVWTWRINGKSEDGLFPLRRVHR